MQNQINMLKAFLGKGGNPQEFLMKNLLGNNTNPMFNNLVNLAKNGKTQDIENFARNICKEKRNRL